MKNLFLMLMMVVATTLTSLAAYDHETVLDTDVPGDPSYYSNSIDKYTSGITSFVSVTTWGVADAYSYIRLTKGSETKSTSASVYMAQDGDSDYLGWGVIGGGKAYFNILYRLEVSEGEPGSRAMAGVYIYW